MKTYLVETEDGMYLTDWPLVMRDLSHAAIGFGAAFTLTGLGMALIAWAIVELANM